MTNRLTDSGVAATRFSNAKVSLGIPTVNAAYGVPNSEVVVVVSDDDDAENARAIIRDDNNRLWSTRPRRIAAMREKESVIVIVLDNELNLLAVLVGYTGIQMDRDFGNLRRKRVRSVSEHGTRRESRVI